jgi:hypothetical protein
VQTFIIRFYTYIYWVRLMTNMTIAVPSDLKSKLDERPEINWSEVARQAWRQKVQQLETLDRLTGKLNVTDKDLEELDKLVRKGVADWHNKRS